jgi:hypothetical protein
MWPEKLFYFILAKYLHFLTKKLGRFWNFIFSSVNSNNFANFLVKFHQNSNMKKREKTHWWKHKKSEKALVAKGVIIMQLLLYISHAMYMLSFQIHHDQARYYIGE